MHVISLAANWVRRTDYAKMLQFCENFEDVVMYDGQSEDDLRIVRKGKPDSPQLVWERTVIAFLELRKSVHTWYSEFLKQVKVAGFVER